jgi:hypothetical protein
MAGGYQHTHNRGKKVIETGSSRACPDNDQQKLSTLFSTAVDNFLRNKYGLLYA